MPSKEITLFLWKNMIGSTVYSFKITTLQKVAIEWRFSIGKVRFGMETWVCILYCALEFARAQYQPSHFSGAQVWVPFPEKERTQTSRYRAPAVKQGSGKWA
jgi:hypothetical protein